MSLAYSCDDCSWLNNFHNVSIKVEINLIQFSDKFVAYMGTIHTYIDVHTVHGVHNASYVLT